MKIIIESKLLEFFEIGARVKQINLARRKFILQFVIGIILSKSVNFSAIAEYFSPDAELKSHIRRMERFFAEYDLDYVQIAILLMCFLPAGKLHLSLDRTNWTLGDKEINFLVLSAYRCGVGVPLFFELLDKKGNSNTQERKAILKKLLRILPVKQIASFSADREFIGADWYYFLVTNKIPFYIRIKSNQKVSLNGVEFEAKYLAIFGQQKHYCNIRHQGYRLHLASKKLRFKAKEEERYLLVLTNAKVEQALNIYRLRWSIEVCFQCLKKRGFNLEDTRLKKEGQLKKLFAMVAIAFAACLEIGIQRHQAEKPMKKRKNGYKPNSFFRHGRDKIRRLFLHQQQLFEQAVLCLNSLFDKIYDNQIQWQNLNFILRL